MLSRISERLKRVRERQMIGRLEEMALFHSTLHAAELPFLVFHLSGPNGIGKTTLLRAFEKRAESQQIPVLFLDARNFEATPEGLLFALRSLLGIPADSDPLTSLSDSDERRVLILDNYEDFDSNDDWVRESFIPQLSAETLVILASPRPPALAWRTDPGWQALIKTVSLRNLSTDEAQELLMLRGVPPAQFQAAMDFTHGYPLALSLIADMAAQPGNEANLSGFTPENAPHIVQALLDQFVAKAPSAAHRAGLEIAAMVRLTTEPLLAEMLEGEDDADAGPDLAHEVFQWLRGLSFIESNVHGLFPHETAREALLADLRWRNRERYIQLHHKARGYYSRRLDAAQGMEQHRILLDYIFLHRDNPLVRSAFDWKESSTVRTDALRETDVPSLLAMVRQFEGEESATIAAHWLRLQPDGVIVFRDRASGAEDEPIGFLFQLALQRTTEEQRECDPAILAAWQHLASTAPLRPGEIATHFRFWMAKNTYHAVSPVQSLIIVHIVRHYLTTRNLAYSFFPVVSPERWAPMFDYAEIARVPQAEFVVGGRPYGIYGNDWRRMPPTVWLARLADKETAISATNATPSVRPEPTEGQLVVLSEEDFATAARSALRHMNEPDALRSNPLLRSRLVSAQGSSENGAATLRKVVLEAVQQLQNIPRISRCYKPLYHTYIQPAPSQERAAEILDLPFSTYRRHLTEGITEVTRILWLKEIGEPDA